MATRRERFLKMQLRHLRRRLKHDDRGWIHRRVIDPVTGEVERVRLGRKWGYLVLGKQDPLDLKQSSYTHAPFLPYTLPRITREVTPAEQGKPPIPFLWGIPYLNYRATGNHQRHALHGYHRRRVFIIKRPPGRMKGLRRAVWVANQVFMRRGFFPDADPLGRHPNQTEVATGAAEAVEDPVWPGMPPE